MRYACTAAVLSLLVAAAASASGRNQYEVWGIDQSNSPGKTYGGTVYIWDGHDLENARRAPGAAAERVDLGGASAAFCLERTGANPVRPHMIAINASQSHAIISFVATGHVLFMDAASRRPVACFRTLPGAGGSRQAHMSTPSPDAVRRLTKGSRAWRTTDRLIAASASSSAVSGTEAPGGP